MDNLDCMSKEDLWRWWANHRHASRNIARALFPERPAGYVRAMQDCANYACNKSVAMTQRELGNIQDALMYEGIADRIYDRLPAFARW